jgi:ABC-type transport system involved in multi-copper enzyme maturation permease subunit
MSGSTLRVLGAIAFNTYREAVRSKVLYSILFFAMLMLAFSAFLGEVSLHQNVRVIKDVGLFVLSLFGNLMAIFLGVSFVYKEIERKSIFNILSKPIRRWQYYLGKFLGILLTLVVQLGLMFVLFLIVLSVWSDGIDTNVFLAFVLTLFEVTLILTVALFFSSFSTPYLSGFLALGVFVIGKGAHLLLQLSREFENAALEAVMTVVDAVAPALYVFNLSTQVTYDLHIPMSYIWSAFLYGASYSAVVLLLGMTIFARRDFV